MSWYAVEEIDEAIENTKELLYPVDRGTWLRLGLLVIFSGGGMGFSNFPTGGTGGNDYEGNFSDIAAQQNPEIKQVLNETSVSNPTAAFSSAQTAGLIVIGGLIFSIALFFFAISSIFEFIYYQSLLDKKVRIRKNFSKHIRNGLRYMLLQLVFLVITVGFLVGGIAGFMLNPIIGILGLLGIILIFIPLSIVMGLVNNFVIPETIMTGESFWSSLKTGLGKARAEIKQTVVYILTRFGIKLVTGTAMMLYVILVLILEFLIFGLVGAVFYFFTPLLAIIPAIVGIIVFIVAIIAGQVVVQTYLNFYALRVFENFGE